MANWVAVVTPRVGRVAHQVRGQPAPLAQFVALLSVSVVQLSNEGLVLLWKRSFAASSRSSRTRARLGHVQHWRNANRVFCAATPRDFVCLPLSHLTIPASQRWRQRRPAAACDEAACLIREAGPGAEIDTEAETETHREGGINDRTAAHWQLDRDSLSS